MRPGNISSTFRPLRSKTSSFGNYIGNFGKGTVILPPGPGEWSNNSWKCPGDKPKDDQEGFHVCCPSGWKKVSYGDTESCGDEQALMECGPSPEGDGFECIRGQWVPIGSGNIAPDQMLEPDIVYQSSTSGDTSMLPVVGGGIALLFVVTIAWKMLS